METRQGRVSTETLRGMAMGQTVIFDLPSAEAVNTGKSIAYRVQHTLGCKFKAMSDYPNNRLILTKIPKSEDQEKLS